MEVCQENNKMPRASMHKLQCFLKGYFSRTARWILPVGGRGWVRGLGTHLAHIDPKVYSFVVVLDRDESSFTEFLGNSRVPANWHLSKQAIHWPVSCDNIVGSSSVLIKLTIFFKVDHWARIMVLGLIAGLSQLTLTREKVNQRIIFSCVKMFFIAFM